MRNFRRFIGIDWSGAKSPVFSRAIAVAECSDEDEAPIHHSGPWSRQGVAEWIEEIVESKVRTLVGIDCNFGYAQEAGLKLLGPRYDYRDLWAAVERASAAEPNYFAGPYWQAHPDLFWTAGKMPTAFGMPRRVTEQVCGHGGYGWPESPFKLIGAKQVGKGGLAGMRMVFDLKKRCGDRLAVWPFEMDMIDQASVVITEIYPRQFLRRAGHGNAKVRTLTELNMALAGMGSKPIKIREFSDHTADALVSAAGLRFLCGSGKTVPERIACPDVDQLTLRREGWIFGAGDQ